MFPDGCGGALPTSTATHLWRGSRRGGGCAAPGARAPPLPRHCPRYATDNGAGAFRRLFLSLAKCWQHSVAAARQICASRPRNRSGWQDPRPPSLRDRGGPRPGAVLSAARGPADEELPPERAAGAPSGLWPNPAGAR